MSWPHPSCTTGLDLDDDGQRITQNPDPAPQVVAEKEAWKIAEQHSLDLVTIHPVFVVGPVLSTRTDATSVQMIKVRHGSGICVCQTLRPAWSQRTLAAWATWVWASQPQQGNCCANSTCSAPQPECARCDCRQ